MMVPSEHYTKSTPSPQSGEDSSAAAAALAKVFHGIGPKRARQLGVLGIETPLDMLYNFPRDWQDRSSGTDLSKVPETSVVFQGRVISSRLIRANPRLGIFKAKMATGDRKVELVWFKHLSFRYDAFAALKAEIVTGADLWVVGKAEGDLLGVREVRVEEFYPLNDPRRNLHVGRIVPVYGLTEGITQRLMRELAHQAVSGAATAPPDPLPPALIHRRKLLSLRQALSAVHFPKSFAELDAARTRLAYEELLLLEFAWIFKRRQTRGLAKNFSYEIKRSLLTPFREGLGFELTRAQKRVINEIFDDMRRPYPMTRLLQGDVGSGKTVVALSALLLAVENGFQAALMVPTEILADQHMATMTQFLKGLPVRCAMLTSRLSKKEREKTVEAVRRGEADIVVGTHALLEGDVQFPKLKVAVIDEQHRFGVRQLTTLRQKSGLLDLLVMTATPIPRTLALALYGDLDVSTLDEMPPNKTTAQTYLAPEAQALEGLKAEVAKGHQAYVVYPIIEESANLDLQSAKAEFERLSAGALAGLRVSLIHGAMPGRTKAKVMAEFAAGRSDVLVATPVIEVGIDVANATVMVIQNADRFGMASLHQLRGRIGRGKLASVCYLVADPKTDEARRRLETLVATYDGFRIGEEDLKIRGPGEFMGTAQHGELTLKIADLNRHADLLAQARQDAEELLQTDPRLLAAENGPLRERILRLYQRQWSCIDLA
ncbi:MAG: ATP-dependent DNA helicase RecG [Elusimicrobia bacterium]|nr:ATP-dependent DNA helicase RecG [Elusimicrobiota bacterium]